MSATTQLILDPTDRPQPGDIQVKIRNPETGQTKVVTIRSAEPHMVNPRKTIAAALAKWDVCEIKRTPPQPKS